MKVAWYPSRRQICLTRWEQNHVIRRVHAGRRAEDKFDLTRSVYRARWTAGRSQVTRCCRSSSVNRLEAVETQLREMVVA